MCCKAAPTKTIHHTLFTISCWAIAQPTQLCRETKKKEMKGGEWRLWGCDHCIFDGVIKKRKNAIEEIEKKKKSSPPKR